MRPNLKDCAAGTLFVAIGLLFAVNAWLGLSIGSAFAMGPGYFPILLGLILIGFGACDLPCRAAQAGGVLRHGVVARRRPRDRRRSCSLRSRCAVSAWRRRSAARRCSRRSRPRATRSPSRSLLSLCLTAFCVLLFVYALQLPYAVIGPWLTMELIDNLALGLAHRAVAAEPVLLLRRRADRHLHRRAAGHRPDRDDRDAAAAHLLPDAGRFADHARRHLLRLAVWRLHHGDPDQPAGRSVVLGDGDRRLPDGAARAGRAGARDRGDRLVHRRHLRDLRDRGRRGAAHRGRAEVRRRRNISP